MGMIIKAFDLEPTHHFYEHRALGCKVWQFIEKILFLADFDIFFLGYGVCTIFFYLYLTTYHHLYVREFWNEAPHI